MARELSAATQSVLIQPQQLNTALRRSQHNQVNAMIRLAGRHGRNVPHPGLQALIAGFQTFTEAYAHELEKANQSGHFPFLLRSGIERLLQEWSILSRACEQRAELDPKYMKVADRRQSMRYNLEQADALMTEYCGRWRPPQSAAYSPLKTPVVYFEKLYRISRALFAPDIPVVSVPLSDYDAPERWQALAHEMGHHVFWNAVALDEFSGLQDRLRQAVAKAVLTRLGVTVYDAAHPVAEKLLKRVGLWAQWLEEVFADVCGVLFAGPAFAHSAQDLAAASVNTPEDLIGHSDQKHPSLYLRPLISLQVVRNLAQAHPDARYRQALLDWAGAGEAETTRRASGLDDYLQTMKSAAWSRGKRIPADMPVGSGLMLSGGLRWELFTSDVAASFHPEAQATLAELAADVPVVVKAVLNARVWPGDQRLWDLVELYGSQPGRTTDAYLAELPAWDTLPQPPGKPDFPPLPALGTLPQNDLTRVMRRLVVGLDAAHVKESERPRIFWTLLSALDIESDAKQYTPHEWSSDHYHGEWLRDVLGQWHRHNADGVTIEWSWSG
jgi:hypothetical protein